MGRLTGMIAAVCMAAALTVPAGADPVTYPQLKEMVTNMGYEPSNLEGAASPMFEVAITTASFKVPIAFELSGSGRYVWARTTLGKFDGSSGRAVKLLKSNATTQPVMFWITSSDMLVLGMAIDNRDVTPEHLRFVMERIANTVDETAPIWNAAE